MSRNSTVILALVAPWILVQGLSAQIEEGTALQYLDFDERDGVREGAYPKLSIEDLRKVSLYSKLAIKDAQVSIADDKYMRRIEAHPRDPEVLIVTSDHFRFTVLKNAAINSPQIPAKDRPRYRFLWIKHATRESPDGNPWLKDLILLPFNKKTGKLTGPWPFPEVREGVPREGPDDEPSRDSFFLKVGDPRPARAKMPPEKKCVIGTFQAGKTDYLVLDVFGGYSWWGKVFAAEYSSLRDQGQPAIEDFHKGSAKGGWISIQWTNPRVKSQPHEVIGTNRVKAEELIRKIPKVLETKVQSETKKGWEDLLLLEDGDEGVNAIDDQLKDLKDFGDLLAWASAYSEKRWEPGFFPQWYGPLEKALEKGEKSHIVTARVLRHAFRRMGFPCVIQGFHRKDPLYPLLTLLIHVPSQRLSWVIVPADRIHYVLTGESAMLYSLPSYSLTVRGQIPWFDCSLGGGGKLGVPVPGP